MKHTIALLALFFTQNSLSNEINCDPTALTYDDKACKAYEIQVSAKNERYTNHIVRQDNAFDAAESYNRKLRRLDKNKKLNHHVTQDIDLYVSTNAKTSASNRKNNKGMQTQIAKVNTMKDGHSTTTKKNFDQLGIGAKIPLNSK
jgi:hypothetical protein